MGSQVRPLTMLGGGGSERERGRGGTPTYVPQNDPHDVLVILNIHKWANFFSKNSFHPSAYRKSKQNWLLDLGAVFLHPPLPTILGL